MTAALSLSLPLSQFWICPICPRLSREAGSALSHRDSVLGVAVGDSSRLCSWIHSWVSPYRKGLWFLVGMMGGLLDAAGQGVAQIREVSG